MQELIERMDIKQVEDLKLIRQALEQLLYVPDGELKPRIIAEIIKYYEKKFKDPSTKIAIFIAYDKSKPCGYVAAHVDPEYKSYSRKCGTFGWLHADEFETCKHLLEHCESFMLNHKIKKLRGNINLPKGLGGIGFQVMGFEAPMLYGVPFNDPNSKVLEYLKRLGYQQDAEYTCVRVTQRIWEKGNDVDPNIYFKYLSLNELKSLKAEIMEVAENSFHSILADASGGVGRFNEIMDQLAQVPEDQNKIPKDLKAGDWTPVNEFHYAWNSKDRNIMQMWVHVAFAKDTDELVGIIFCLPDLYQLWKGEAITRVNVDTVMIKKAFAGKGIFSNLNNLGRLTGEICGITYFEGTGIWSNNNRAVKSIFPHSKPVRKHVVVQKRLKKNQSKSI